MHKVTVQMTGHVTGHKRKNEHLHGDVPPPAAKHPTPPLNTSRCTLQTIPSQQAPLQEPPDFPGEPLNPHFLGAWGWLPPSLLEEFHGKRYDPLMQGSPPKEPDPLPSVLADLPLTVIAQPAAGTDTETDAQLLKQLQAVCAAHGKKLGRASIAVEILQRDVPLQERIAQLKAEVKCERKVALCLITLAARCKPGTRVREFLMSLFLVMQRTPDARCRRNLIDNLPPALSPELQSHAMDAQNYWRNTAISPHCNADTQELARAVCQHFGWPVPD